MTSAADQQDVQKVTRPTLIAMVVGGMVGAGVFSIPRNFAQATGVYGALIACAIAGAGMLMLAFVLQTLANRKPDLDAGVYAYARAGFGPYLGFFSAFGYWASACVGNVSDWVQQQQRPGQVGAEHRDDQTDADEADRDCVLLAPDFMNKTTTFSYRPSNMQVVATVSETSAATRTSSCRSPWTRLRPAPARGTGSRTGPASRATSGHTRTTGRT